jgi:hypothetical protein
MEPRAWLPSLPGLTRQSIFSQKLLAKMMDPRVKPAGDATARNKRSALRHSCLAECVMRGQKRVEDARERAYARGSTFFAKTFCEMDGLHRNSGLPELRSIMRRKSGKPDLRCQARQ